MLPIVIVRGSGGPLAAQIASSIRRLTTDGTLRAGEEVPSTRRLANQLGVSRSTVVQAYDQLVSERCLITVPGGKTRVHPGASKVPTAGAPTPQPQPKRPPAAARRKGLDLTPRNTLSAGPNDSLWRESWRRAAAGTEEDEGPRGLLWARLAIAEHLRLLRGLNVDVEDIFLTGGAREGLQLLLSAADLPVVAVENPGYPGLRGVVRRSRSAATDSPVNQWGLIPSAIPEDAAAALVTPNHVYPAGGSMPAPQRSELLRVADSRDLLIIEDDLDSEFRHVGPVPPTLWELAPSSVVHLGTFNRVLTGDAKIGYLLAPRHLHGALLQARADLGAGTPLIAQRAIGNYLQAGGLRRHITRRRRDLARRRALLAQHLEGFPLELQAGGTAVVRTSRAAQVLAECEKSGLVVGSMRDYWHGQEEGIMFGYAAPSLDDLDAAARQLAQVLKGNSCKAQ